MRALTNRFAPRLNVLEARDVMNGAFPGCGFGEVNVDVVTRYTPDASVRTGDSAVLAAIDVTSDRYARLDTFDLVNADGTGPLDGNHPSLRVYLDNDGNGTADTTLNSTIHVNGDGTVTVDPLYDPLLRPGQPLHLIIEGDFAETVAGTYGAEVGLVSVEDLSGNELYANLIYAGSQPAVITVTQPAFTLDVDAGNANPDADGTNPFTGIGDLARFRFSATMGIYGEDAVLQTVPVRLEFDNVLVQADSLDLVNVADRTVRVDGVVTDGSGNTLTGLVTGTVYVSFPSLDLSQMDTVLDGGTSDDLAVTANVVNSRILSYRASSMQGFLLGGDVVWQDRLLDGSYVTRLGIGDGGEVASTFYGERFTPPAVGSDVAISLAGRSDADQYLSLVANVYNFGPTQVNNLPVSVDVPAGASYQSGWAGWDARTGRVEGVVNLAPGESIALVLVLNTRNVPNGLMTVGGVTNLAADPNQSNNVSQLLVTVQHPAQFTAWAPPSTPVIDRVAVASPDRAPVASVPAADPFTGDDDGMPVLGGVDLGEQSPRPAQQPSFAIDWRVANAWYEGVYGEYEARQRRRA